MSVLVRSREKNESAEFYSRTLRAFTGARFPQKIDEAWLLVLRRFNYLDINSLVPALSYG